MRTQIISILHAISNATEPRGPRLRIYCSISILIQGTTRLVSGHSATPMNFLSSRVYGILLLLGGLFLLVTSGKQRRCCVVGRWAAISAATLLLLLLADIWGAWVSIGGLTWLVLNIANEVRQHECD